MPVPHFNIKITQRSKGKSAVAGAAYQAGEKLFSEYDQKTKNYTCKKEVVYTEIMLPPSAPPEYADRAALWNSVEEIEKQWNSQLARRFVAALPREVPMELLPQMVKEYCEEHFVSKGMCCDFAIHDPDPPGHNPHCHFMLTMRAIDENGKWLPKSRKVYDLDENGEHIKLPSGRWKSHKEDTVDWNEQYHAEEWRHGWEVVQNKYLELAGSPERIDMRSYERQGLDIIPTVHMGTAVSALERKGIATNIGNLNRDIKAANRMMNAIRSTIKNLRDWIADILEATKEVLAENEAAKKNASPNLAVLLRDYLNLRKAERSEWSRYGQQKGTTDDLKTISQATVYLQRHELFTLEDLDIALQGVSEKATAIREDMQTAANRMKAITTIQNAVADCEKHKAVHDKYIKIGWKIRKEAYAESHKDELTAFNKAYRTLKKHGDDLNVDLKALQKEYDDLKISHTNLKAQLAAVNEELKPMKDIRYWVGKVLSPEQTATKQPEPKHSLKERLLYEQEQKKQVQKAPKQKKQDMELYQALAVFTMKMSSAFFVSRKDDAMNVFEAVKQNVTTRQAAELYGIRVGRNGMAVCPFHNDKNPSMKLDRRFHCFGCQADGDAVDFVSRLFGLPSKEAAMKIADDFGISYDSRQKPSIRPKIREPTPEQKYQQEENHCYKVLSDYFHLLRKWEKQYAPQRTDEVWHPLFVEALQKKSYIEYLLDILLYDTPEEKKALVAEQRKEVMKLEQRIAGHTAEHDRGRSQRKSGLDR